MAGAVDVVVQHPTGNLTRAGGAVDAAEVEALEQIGVSAAAWADGRYAHGNAAFTVLNREDDVWRADPLARQV